MGFFIIIPQFKHWLQSQIQRHPADKRNLLQQIYYKFISDGLSPPLGLCLLAQSLWRESNVLDNWQLTMLPLSELCESNPRWVRDNLSASLCVIGRFPQPEKKTTRIFMYVCVRACMGTCIYACLNVCLHAHLACVYCGIVQYLRWGE